VTYRYDELTWPEVREAVERDPVVVLPVGTTEQHGYHCAISLDSVCAEGVARAAVELTQPHSLLMPPVVYSFNENQMDFPGTIAIDGPVIVEYVACIGRSLARHGFRHILIVNGHGSNVPFIDAASRRVNNEHDALCAYVSWWSLLRPEDLGWRESVYPGGMGHACELETSLLLHLRPELVELSLAVDEVGSMPMSDHFVFDLTGGGPVGFIEYYSRHSITGVMGQPTLASAEKGKAALDAAARALANVIHELRARPVRPRHDLHDAARHPAPVRGGAS
jgi:creatinine amidohydrolase